MKHIASLLLIFLLPFSAHAIKLNQRGEKMVSQVNVVHADGKRAPYSIKFGYDTAMDINLMEFERKGVNHEIANIGRGNGEIWRQDYVDGNKFGHYIFKTDSHGRPKQMQWFDRNLLNGNDYLNSTFTYDYNYQDYTLSITHIYADDKEAGLRELVCVDNGNAYMLKSVMNLQKGTESKPFANCRGMAYSDTINDLNIDLQQLVCGYCRVGGRFDIPANSNFVFLANWTNTKSKNLIGVLDKFRMEYIIDINGNVKQVVVKWRSTNEIRNTISITYVE